MSLTPALVVSSLLILARTLAAAPDSKSTALFVTFRPAVALSSQGSSAVSLKIRLSEGASAQLWLADACSNPTGSAYLVQRSGEYQIPVSSLGQTGTMACLSSTDGLRDQIQLAAPVKEPVRCVDSTCSAL